MKNKKWFLSIGIGICILFLGIMCFVIQKTGKSREEEAGFVKQLTDIEKEELYHDYVEKTLALMLKRTGKVLDCEVDINYSESKIAGVDIKFTVPEGSIENDTLRTDISESISRALNISAESITVSESKNLFP